MVSKKYKVKIRETQDEMRVLELLAQYHCETGDSSVSWTAASISRQLSMGIKTIESALERLSFIEHVYSAGQEWYITQEGLDSFDSINSGMFDNLETPYHAWRIEALTGVTSNGQRSSITWAALDSGKQRNMVNSAEHAIVDACGMSEHVRRIAERLGMTADDVLESMVSGEIHRCSSCGRQQLHHADRTRNGWQGACIECRRERRSAAYARMDRRSKKACANDYSAYVISKGGKDDKKTSNDQ